MAYDLTLYSFLKKHLRVCRKSGRGDETIIRCPFCGDSRKSAKSAHFYIQNKPPYKMYCQKCTTSGIFNNEMLGKLGLFDVEVSNMLKNSYKQYLKNINIKYGGSFTSYFLKQKIIFEPNQFTDLELDKIDYVNKRLGIEIEYKDITKYKLVLNLEDFLANNKIEKEKILTDEKGKINKKKEMMFELCQKYAVGFLTFDKNIIVFRSLDEEKTGFRYHNFRIFDDDFETTKKFYALTDTIDLKSSVIEIVMSEGILDIVGIYNHIYKKENKVNRLYISANGKGFDFILTYLSTLGILNCDIFIYSDNDVKLSYYEKLQKYNLVVKYNGAKIHYNKKSKDFGVPIENIELDRVISI